MKLIPVDPGNEEHIKFLYELFCSRPDVARVSSKGNNQSYEEHVEFVRNHPYADWSLIVVDEYPVDFYDALSGHRHMPLGSVFLSQPARPSVVGDELSVDILPAYQGKGYAEQALRMMIEKHGPRRYIANVACSNYRSMALFAKLGFTECQVTFEFNYDGVRSE